MLNVAYLEEKAKEARRLTIEMIGRVGVGHIGGALSIVDVLALLYYEIMNIKPESPKWEDRDRLILSKGHAGPALYAILAMKGYFPMDWLETLNQLGTNLPSHCDMKRTTGIDMTAGSLGQGISAAVGMAIGARIDGKSLTVYTLIGDGECQEGEVWEAAMLANQFKLDNLIAFMDYNKFQIDGSTDEINTLGDVEKKWQSFGWHVQRVDGHDMKAVYNAVAAAGKVQEKPSMIILDTIKGKGAFFAEGKAASHNMPVTAEDVKKALLDLS